MAGKNTNNILKFNDDGFTLLEALIGLTIFSLTFMALTSGIWSATSTLRTASHTDESVITSQDVVEMLSVIDLNTVTSPIGSSATITRGDQIIEYDILNTVNSTGGAPLFKTIAISVYYDKDGDGTADAEELKMRTYYRRMVYPDE